MFTCMVLALVLAGEFLDPVCSAVQPFIVGKDVKTARVAVVGQNGSVHLRCPSGTSHSWYKLMPEKQPVALNERIKEVSDTLLITEANVNDAGRYLCVSDTGSLESILTVTGNVEVPGAPHDVKVVDKSQTSVKLSWTAPDGNSSIQQYQIEYKTSEGSWERVSVPGQHNETTITKLKPGTIYHLRIVAANKVGSSGPSDTIRFITNEDAPGGPPTDIRVEAANARALNVWWKPPERALRNGRVLGYNVGYKPTDSDDEYFFQTVESEFGKDNHLEISELEPYTPYLVTVEAFNKVGLGPRSEALTKHTAEDAPGEPPHNVTCMTLTSQRIRVSWAAPPPATTRGVLKGYKVIYERSGLIDENAKDVVFTSSSITFLDGLHKYTNYTVQVLAYTEGGDGPPSDPIQCQTEEDLPGEPANIKALVKSSNSVLVSWKPPVKPSGIIEHYTLYVKQASTSSYKVQLTQLFHEVTELDRSKSYKFYVTASTCMGEGEPSTTVLQSPAAQIPARITLFDDTLTTTHKKNVKLPCTVVGVPLPETVWKFNGEPLLNDSRVYPLPDGSLWIKRVRRNETGEYSCHVKNQFGQDSITYKLIVQGVPHSPQVTLLGSTDRNITVKIQPNITDTAPVHWYTIYYDHQALNLTSSVKNCTLKYLRCGMQYDLYVVGYNSIGRGDASNKLTVRTSGSAPIQPELSEFITPLSDGVLLDLDSWSDGGCPMSYFQIQYVEYRNGYYGHNYPIKPGGTHHIKDMYPSSNYTLKITASNDAYATTAEYTFQTLP